jgi:hypothetical protein
MTRRIPHPERIAVAMGNAEPLRELRPPLRPSPWPDRIAGLLCGRVVGALATLVAIGMTR